MIGLILRQQLYRAPQIIHGGSKILLLQVSQAELIVSRSVALVLLEGAPVHDTGFFVFALVEVLIAEIEVTFLGDVGVRIARYQGHDCS